MTMSEGASDFPIAILLAAALLPLLCCLFCLWWRRKKTQKQKEEERRKALEDEKRRLEELEKMMNEANADPALLSQALDKKKKNEMAAEELLFMEVLNMSFDPTLPLLDDLLLTDSGGGVKIVPLKLLPMAAAEEKAEQEADTMEDLRNAEIDFKDAGVRLRPPKLLGMAGTPFVGDDEDLENTHTIHFDGSGVRARPPRLFPVNTDEWNVNEPEEVTAAPEPEPIVPPLWHDCPSWSLDDAPVRSGFDGGGGARAMPLKLTPVDVGKLNEMVEEQPQLQALEPEQELLPSAAWRRSKFKLALMREGAPGLPGKDGGGIRIPPPLLVPMHTMRRAAPTRFASAVGIAALAGGTSPDASPTRSPAPGRMRDALKKAALVSSGFGKRHASAPILSSTKGDGWQVVEVAPLLPGEHGGGGVRTAPPELIESQYDLPEKKSKKELADGLRKAMQAMQADSSLDPKALKDMLRTPNGIREAISKIEAEQAALEAQQLEPSFLGAMLSSLAKGIRGVSPRGAAQQSAKVAPEPTTTSPEPLRRHGSISRAKFRGVGRQVARSVLVANKFTPLEPPRRLAPSRTSSTLVDNPPSRYAPALPERVKVDPVPDRPSWMTDTLEPQEEPPKSKPRAAALLAGLGFSDDEDDLEPTPAAAAPSKTLTSSSSKVLLADSGATIALGGGKAKAAPSPAGAKTPPPRKTAPTRGTAPSCMARTPSVKTAPTLPAKATPKPASAAPTLPAKAAPKPVNAAPTLPANAAPTLPAKTGGGSKEPPPASPAAACAGAKRSKPGRQAPKMNAGNRPGAPRK